MDYYFCNMQIHINTIDIIHNSIYDIFRIQENEPNCSIQVKVVEHFDVINAKLVYENIQGLKVMLDQGCEYRYYNNYFSGEIQQMLIDNGEHRILQILRKSIPMNEMQFLNCLALEKILYEQNRFILHSSFIETEKGAVLFTAPSQTGKSTQANLWNRYRNAEIINGDRSGIWKGESGWIAGGVPWCGTSGIMKNKILPLLAIVNLKQGPKNEIQSTRYVTNVANILEQLTINPWNRNMLITAQEFCMLLCQEVPILQLSCRPDEDAVKVLEKELEKL